MGLTQPDVGDGILFFSWETICGHEGPIEKRVVLLCFSPWRHSAHAGRRACVGFLCRPNLSRRTITPQQMRRIVSDHSPAPFSFVAVVGLFRPRQARGRRARLTYLFFASSPTAARAWIRRPVTTTSARASRASWPLRRRHGTCSRRTAAGWEWMDTASRVGMDWFVNVAGSTRFRAYREDGAGHHEPRWCLSLGRMRTVASGAYGRIQFLGYLLGSLNCMGGVRCPDQIMMCVLLAMLALNVSVRNASCFKRLIEKRRSNFSTQIYVPAWSCRI
jgi:hypothetical protein